MINRFLHALRNRKGAFNEAMFAEDPNFVPAALSREANHLRQMLYLHVTSTDYYLKAFASAVAAYPDIELLLDDKVTSYRMSDMPPRGVEISGADFLSKQNLVGFFTDQASQTLPVGLTYLISYFEPGWITIRCVETGIIRRTTCLLTGSAPTQTMRVEWPDEFPFEGPLSLKQHWVPGSSIEILVEPSKFPYEALVARITGNAYLMRLLINAQLVDEFLSFPDYQRKIAIAATVLAMDNPSAYVGSQ